MHALLLEVAGQPVEQPQASRRHLACRFSACRVAVRALTIARPALRRDEHALAKPELHEEHLVLEHAAEGGLEATDAIEDAAPHQRIAGRGRLRTVLDQQQQRFGRLECRVWRHAEIAEFICCRRVAAPAVPQQRATVDHGDVGAHVEESDLLLQLVGFPGVVRIEEADVLAVGVREPEIARRAHAAGLVARMLDVADAVGKTLRVVARDLRAAIRRAVVDEDDLPRRVRLCPHAVDGFGEKAFLVEKDHDARDERLGHQRAKSARRLAKVGPSQSPTEMRGSWKGSLRAVTQPSSVVHARSNPADAASLAVAGPRSP